MLYIFFTFSFFIYIHISHPNCNLKWPPVHNFIGTQLNPTSRSHPYPEQGNRQRQSLIPMEMSFLTQLGCIFLQGVIHLLRLPRSLSLHAMWGLHLTPKNLLTPCVISEMKAGPLSLWMLPGRPRRGILSFSRAFAISEDFSVLVG